MHSHLLTLTRTLTHPPHSCCFWLLYTFVVSSVVLSPCPSGQRWLERPRSRVARVRGPRQCNPASPIRTPSLSLCLVYLPSSDAAQSSRMRRLAYIREKPTRCSIVWIRMPPTSLLRTAAGIESSTSGLDADAFWASCVQSAASFSARQSCPTVVTNNADGMGGFMRHGHCASVVLSSRSTPTSLPTTPAMINVMYPCYRSWCLLARRPDSVHSGIAASPLSHTMQDTHNDGLVN